MLLKITFTAGSNRQIRYVGEQYLKNRFILCAYIFVNNIGTCTQLYENWDQFSYNCVHILTFFVNLMDFKADEFC